MNQEKPLVKKLKITEKVNAAWEQYHKEGWRAKEAGEKICWVAGGGSPMELLNAMDIWFYLPELQSVTAASDGLIEQYMTLAENDGYSMDGVCPYMRGNIGEIMSGRPNGYPPGTLGAMPDPDYLLMFKMFCGTHVYWWEALKRNFGVPLFIGDSIYYNRPIEDRDAKYYADGMRDCVAFLEEQTGKKLDPERLKEAQELSGKTGELIYKILELNKNVPAPFDELDLMGPILAALWWRGIKKSPWNSVEIFEKALAEVEERVRNGVGAIEEEKFRLVFDSNPPWYKGDWISAYMAEKGAVYVTSSFNRYWTNYDGFNYGWCVTGRDWSFEDVARCNIPNWINAGLNERINYIAKLAKDYRADAAIIMDNRGCRILSYAMLDEEAYLEQKLGIPTMLYEGSMADPRHFDEETVKSKLDIFFEMLADKKKKG
jgi:benzoyl-CoA reductase/2-hydroxyglutaryl-CoA dehydratase subunit BcrC/BadD/HgdB